MPDFRSSLPAPDAATLPTYLRPVGLPPQSIEAQEPDYGAGPRWNEAAQAATGPPKGLGFFGPLVAAGGEGMTEVSRDGEVNGKPMQYPLIVPTLTRDELAWMLKHGAEAEPPESIEQKAQAHATARVNAGLDPFAQPGEEQLTRYPDLKRFPVPQGRVWDPSKPQVPAWDRSMWQRLMLILGSR